MTIRKQMDKQEGRKESKESLMMQSNANYELSVSACFKTWMNTFPIEFKDIGRLSLVSVGHTVHSCRFYLSVGSTSIYQAHGTSV